MKKIGCILFTFIILSTSCTSNHIPPAKEIEKNGAENTAQVDNAFEAKYHYAETVARPVTLGISNQPAELAMLKNRGKLEALPKFDPFDNNAFSVDLRGYDLSHLNMTEDSLVELMAGSFNTATKWPETLPMEFNPSEIMELGKSPGLHVKTLHEQGITGKGIGIAIIDQALLVGHNEYKDQLKLYEEINIVEKTAAMHGAAVASIAVGKTVGVAPEADLYYIASMHGEVINQSFVQDFTWLAMAIDRVLEVNQSLPEDAKIRVISISVGWASNVKGYTEVVGAVHRANEQGIFVVSSSLDETYGFGFDGIGRSWYSDSNDPTAYRPGYWWEKRFYNSVNSDLSRLMVPMEGITTASPAGIDDYEYYPRGGWSWSIPYIAGLYALACQKKPDVTPTEFWRAAMKTGDVISIERDEKTYQLGRIVNPVNLFEELQQ